MRFIDRVKKFLIVGSSAAFVNFLLMIFFVETLGFRNFYLINVANVLSIEISIIYNFFFSRGWTWRDVPKKQGKSLIAQFMSFNLAALTGIGIRVIVFAILEKWGVFYLINVALGMSLVATVDFILYDKLVFRRRVDERQHL